MWFWLALIALLCWSGSDLFSKMGSRPEDHYSHWKMVMMVGTVMGIHAAFEVLVMGTSISWEAILVYAPASLLYIFSMVLGYVGLRYIELSISSPICNSSGAIAAVFCFIILRQTLEPLQTFAVVIVCLAVVALGIIETREDSVIKEKRRAAGNVKYTRSIIAILFPILYCLLDAAGTVADSVILETLDEGTANVAYELTFLLMAVLAFIYVVVIKKEKLGIKREGPKAVAAVFETGGQFAYVYAIGANAIAAAPMISAYCVASVLWSRIFLKEKLSRKHYLTIAVAVVGIVILGMEG